MEKNYSLTSLVVLLITSTLFALVFSQTALSISQSTRTAQNISSSTFGSSVLKNVKTINGTEIQITNDTLNVRNVTSIEGSFRIVSVSNLDNHAGIVWSVGSKNYYALIRPSVSKLSIFSTTNGEFISTQTDPPFVKGVLYTLKVGFTKNTIDVYLDNVFQVAFHIPYLSVNMSISKVGIRSYNAVAQFEPLKIEGH